MSFVASIHYLHQNRNSAGDDISPSRTYQKRRVTSYDLEYSLYLPNRLVQLFTNERVFPILMTRTGAIPSLRYSHKWIDHLGGILGSGAKIMER
ncbi:hypothetical protein [Bacillus wiedmannii]|uniref:hypothetical protein n=1 Tax=Bacillus wiedmannii TaxID=1890302 RepID=UPI003D23A7E6